MPERIFDCLNFVRREWVILMLPLFNSIGRVVHFEAAHTFNLRYICRVNFEAVFLFNVILNAFVGRLLRYLAGIHLHFDLDRLWTCFPRQEDYRLNVF